MRAIRARRSRRRWQPASARGAACPYRPDRLRAAHNDAQGTRWTRRRCRVRCMARVPARSRSPEEARRGPTNAFSASTGASLARPTARIPNKATKDHGFVQPAKLQNRPKPRIRAMFVNDEGHSRTGGKCALRPRAERLASLYRARERPDRADPAPGACPARAGATPGWLSAAGVPSGWLSAAWLSATGLSATRLQLSTGPVPAARLWLRATTTRLWVPTPGWLSAGLRAARR